MKTAYDLIAEFYGTRCAKRSGVPLINHINEGLKILDLLNCCDATKQAYAIHPIVQDGESLAKNYENVQHLDGRTLIFAMEYRRTANAWLCGMKKPKNPLSPLHQVNLMLVADKIQNRKDFEVYHKGTHENSAALTQYFADWLDVLGVSEADYIKWLELIK